MHALSAENLSHNLFKFYLYLKETELKITKIQRKPQQWVTITQSRFIDKIKIGYEK